MKLIKDIIQGAGYLEGYGEHPGTSMLIVLVLCGGLAGASSGGLAGFFGGSIVMVLCMFPLWVIGCVGRARDYQRRNH